MMKGKMMMMMLMKVMMIIMMIIIMRDKGKTLKHMMMMRGEMNIS